YRLNVIPIAIPPLRERPEDIPLLACYFVEKYNQQLGRQVDPLLPADVLADLAARPWPGNLRELENVVQRGVALAQGAAFVLERITGARAPQGTLEAARENFERAYLTDLLARCQGNVSEAARRAGLSRVSLYDKLRKLGLRAS